MNQDPFAPNQGLEMDLDTSNVLSCEIVEASTNDPVQPIIQVVPSELVQKQYIDLPVNISNSISVNNPPSTSEKPVIEGIVIPPDPENGNAIAESYESMCIDVEPEIQLDLVSVIAAMKCHRIIAFIATLLLAAAAIAFLVFKFYDSGFLFILLCLIQLLGYGLAFRYSLKIVTFVVCMYIVGIILSIVYIVIYWYDLFRDSSLNDLLEIITISIYTLLAVGMDG